MKQESLNATGTSSGLSFSACKYIKNYSMSMASMKKYRLAVDENW